MFRRAIGSVVLHSKSHCADYPKQNYQEMMVAPKGAEICAYCARGKLNSRPSAKVPEKRSWWQFFLGRNNEPRVRD